MADLLTIEEAQQLILERVRPLGMEKLPLEDSEGRVLAKAAKAIVDLPPFPSSAMDGFAVRSADTPGQLPVVFRIAAGSPAPRSLDEGEAMGIATGGVVPEGADAVIPVEYVVEDDNVVRIPDAADRKSTRLNSSHSPISYAVFCLKKKTALASRLSC